MRGYEVYKVKGVLEMEAKEQRTKKMEIFESAKAEVINKLEEINIGIARRFTVKRIGVFGSFARGEETPESDIDILVEISKPISLLDFSGLKIEIEEAIGKKTDLVEYETIKPLIKKNILNEEIRII